MSRARWACRAAVTMALLTALQTTAAAEARTSGLYADDDRSVHEREIESLAIEGVTRGCGLGRYCPTDLVTRGQMAAFLDRAFDLPSTERSWFVDDDRSPFVGSIDRLRAAGITSGCNPPRNDRFCPDAPVTRGQMAAFLSEAMDLPPSAEDAFVDDDDSVFEASAQALRAAGITLGCNPPDRDRFCPDDRVTRAQMASFLARALELAPPCDPTTPGCTASDRMHPAAFRWDGLTLRTPSSATELVGMHESNHDGARDLTDLAAVPSVLMESRSRTAGRRSALDIVVHPAVELRAPVTGTVKRAGTYTLYCRYRDDFLVIEPDRRRGIEVKMLHIDGVMVRPGDRVVAGVTIVAPRATKLPFASQVDDHSSWRNWPHTHVEVIDTSIPDRSTGGGC